MHAPFLVASFALATSFFGEVPIPVQVSAVHLRVLRGSSGKPLPKAQVVITVVPETTYVTPLERTTDARGTVSLLVGKDTELRAHVLQYPTCRHVAKADRKQPSPGYAVEQILSSGVVQDNGCNRHSIAPTPGELTLFVRPLHWWERLSY